MSSAIMFSEEAPERRRDSSVHGDLPCRLVVKAMARKKGRKHTSKKQRGDYLSGVHHVLAALYWFVRLVLLLWDKFCN